MPKPTLPYRDAPFSLACRGCHMVGFSPKLSAEWPRSIEQAVADGWKLIEYDGGPYWNFMGWCPKCGPALTESWDKIPAGWKVDA